MILVQGECERNKAARASAHLFISHELDGRLRSDFDDIDPVSSPKRSHAPLPDHLTKASNNLHAVALGGVDLGDRSKVAEGEKCPLGM